MATSTELPPAPAAPPPPPWISNGQASDQVYAKAHAGGANELLLKEARSTFGPSRQSGGAVVARSPHRPAFRLGSRHLPARRGHTPALARVARAPTSNPAAPPPHRPPPLRTAAAAPGAAPRLRYLLFIDSSQRALKPSRIGLFVILPGRGPPAVGGRGAKSRRRVENGGRHRRRVGPFHKLNALPAFPSPLRAGCAPSLRPQQELPPPPSSPPPRRLGGGLRVSARLCAEGPPTACAWAGHRASTPRAAGQRARGRAGDPHFWRTRRPLRRSGAELAEPLFAPEGPFARVPTPGARSTQHHKNAGDQEARGPARQLPAHAAGVQLRAGEEGRTSVFVGLVPAGFCPGRSSVACACSEVLSFCSRTR